MHSYAEESDCCEGRVDADQAILFRMAERLTLTMVIVLAVIVVMAGFWRGVSRLEFDGSNAGLGGSVMLATPVLMVAVLVGYAWVSLNAPVTVDAKGGFIGASPGGAAADGGTTRAPPPTADDTATVDNSALRRNEVGLMIGALNCLAADNTGAPGELREGLARAKLALMRPVWNPAWGDPEAFALAVELGTTLDAYPQARNLFNRKAYECPVSPPD